VLIGTQIIGDANSWPVLKAAPSFVGLGVLSTDVYVGGKGPDGNDNEYYINTSRFYGQIRNIRIDITATNPTAYICAVHYQVAQATTIQNVELIAKTGTVSGTLANRALHISDAFTDSTGHVCREWKRRCHVRCDVYRREFRVL